MLGALRSDLSTRKWGVELATAAMTLFSCCSCDPAGEEETQIQTSPLKSNSAQDGPSSADFPPLTLEEQRREKERLQALVKSFAKAAVSGAPCELFEQTSRRRVPATYFLDRGLRKFSVLLENGTELFFLLSALQEASAFSSLEPTPEKESFLQSFGDSVDSRTVERLAVLEYVHPSTGKTSRMHLLDLTAADASQITTALKILKLYAVSASDSDKA